MRAPAFWDADPGHPLARCLAPVLDPFIAQMRLAELASAAP
jgi:hypothetical protein